MYNVELSVGPNSANHPEDVLLVQFFLQRIAVWDLRTSQFAWSDYRKPDVEKPLGFQDLGLDGKFGSSTAAAILAFQTKYRGQYAVFADGRVDRAVANASSKNVSTIYLLNFLYSSILLDRPFDNIASHDHSVPTRLVPLFSRAKKKH
jgi:hypothetical protein